MGRNTRGQSTVRKVYTLFFLLFIFARKNAYKIFILNSYRNDMSESFEGCTCTMDRTSTLLSASLLSLGFHHFSTHSILSYTSSSILDEDEQRLNPQRYFSLTIAWHIYFVQIFMCDAGWCKGCCVLLLFNLQIGNLNHIWTLEWLG